MACSNSTIIYWEGNNFSSAPQFYTDATFTTVAPDGWYSLAGTYRYMSSGVLGPATTCPTCNFSCNTGVVTGGGEAGVYLMSIDMGAATGAIIIRFRPRQKPSRAVWTFDGLTASEYSSATYGYKEGLIGEQQTVANGGEYLCFGYENAGPFTVSTDLGSQGLSFPGSQHIYNSQVVGFSETLDAAGLPVPVVVGPYNSATSSVPPKVSLFNGIADYFTMVVPKPNPTPTTLNLQIESLCSANIFDIRINCPVSLNNFNGGAIDDPCGTLGTPFYTAHVGNDTGISTDIAVNDWAFVDADGVTPKPAGQYPVTFGAVPATHFVTVDSNGIVTDVVACP